MIGWHKDKVVKGNVHSLHGEQSLSRRSPWALLPPLYLYYMWLHPASPRCPRWKRCKRRAECKLTGQSDFMCGQIALRSQSRLGKRKAVCLMVSTYFRRAQHVGGGVVEEQCVSVCEALH